MADGESEEEARAVMEVDPLVQSGLVPVTLHKFNAGFVGARAFDYTQEQPAVGRRLGASSAAPAIDTMTSSSPGVVDLDTAQLLRKRWCEPGNAPDRRLPSRQSKG